MTIQLAIALYLLAALLYLVGCTMWAMHKGYRPVPAVILVSTIVAIMWPIALVHDFILEPIRERFWNRGY